MSTYGDTKSMLGDMSSVSVTASGAYGSRPDYGSGPYLELLTSAVRLAYRDLQRPEFHQEARDFLDGDLVDLFLDCLQP